MKARESRIVIPTSSLVEPQFPTFHNEKDALNHFQTENKSALFPGLGDSIYQRLIWTGWNVLSSYVAIQYYMQVAPLYNAIHMITAAGKHIRPVVYDTETDEFLYDDEHPVLQLLKFPNADITYAEYFERWSTYFLITGNTYAACSGRPNEAPYEIYSVPPQSVTIAQAHDGFPDTFEITNQYQSRIFKRAEVPFGHGLDRRTRFRFYDWDREAEIYHSRSFNPYWGINQNYGVSQLCSIYYEIETYILTMHHNLSLLDKSVKLSGAFKSDHTLSDEQEQRLNEQINSLYQGANNTGRPIILNGGLSYEKIDLSNLDMDFDNLDRRMTHRIYNHLQIPLPLISQDNSSYNNLTTAVPMFYYFAVLPMVNFFFSEMSDFLMHRYPNIKDSEGKWHKAENLILTYDVDDIEALKSEKQKEVTSHKSLDIFTINELRAMLGYEPLDGGDVILRANNLYPQARDVVDHPYVHPAQEAPPQAPRGVSPQPVLPQGDELSDLKPLPPIDGQDDEQAMGKPSKRYAEARKTLNARPRRKMERRRKDSREILSNVVGRRKDALGNPLFTPEAITDLADEHGYD